MKLLSIYLNWEVVDWIKVGTDTARLTLAQLFSLTCCSHNCKHFKLQVWDFPTYSQCRSPSSFSSPAGSRPCLQSSFPSRHHDSDAKQIHFFLTHLAVPKSNLLFTPHPISVWQWWMVAFTIYRLDMYFPAHLLNDTNSQTAPFRPLLSSPRLSNFGPAFFSSFRPLPRRAFIFPPSRTHSSFHHLAHAPNILSPLSAPRPCC